MAESTKKEIEPMINAQHSRFVWINRILVGIVLAIFVISLAFDIRQQKRIRWDQVRDRLAFTDLLALENSGSSLDQDTIREYLNYFLYVLETDPLRADAQAMAGFCHFHLQQKGQAIAAYERACELNSHFLWFHYNLGVLFFAQGRYEQAFEAFKKALRTTPEDNIEFLKSSRTLVYILFRVRSLNPQMNERLRNGYENSAYFVGECLKKMGKMEQAKVLQNQMQSAGIDQPKKKVDLMLKVF